MKYIIFLYPITIFSVFIYLSSVAPPLMALSNLISIILPTILLTKIYYDTH